MKFTFRSYFVIGVWKNKINTICHCASNSCRKLLSLSGCWAATVAVLNACVNSHRILKLDSNAMHIEQHASSPWLFTFIFFSFFFFLKKIHFIFFFVEQGLRHTVKTEIEAQKQVTEQAFWSMYHCRKAAQRKKFNHLYSVLS